MSNAAPNSEFSTMSAAGFMEGVGVDTHIAYTDGEYANPALIISDLNYLGVNQIRDGISNGAYGSAPLSSYIAIAQAGIKYTFIVEGSSNADLQSELSLIDQVQKTVPGSVIAIEGPNEINNQPVTYNGVTGLQGALNLQADLYADVKADPLLSNAKVDYFTGYNAGGIGIGPDPVATGLADNDNQHPYPNFGQAPAFWVSRAQALGNTVNASEPAVYTETGYSSLQVDITVQAKYTLDLIMDAAQQNISKTYLYELMDAYAPGSPQGDDGFGLFDYTKAAKPVGVGIHNLSAILNDTGNSASTFSATPLNYSLANLPATGNSLAIEKSDGTYVIAVWAEPQLWNATTGVEVAAPTETVTVNLPTSYSSIQVFDPLTGTSSLASITNQSSVSVQVTDHPILIELGPQTASAPVVSFIGQAITSAATSAGDLITLTGTVSSASSVNVEIFDGAADLGAATVDSTGHWTFTADLLAGTHALSALATSEGQSTSTPSEPAVSITTAPVSGGGEVVQSTVGGALLSQASYTADGHAIFANYYGEGGSLLVQDGFAVTGAKSIEIIHSADGSSVQSMFSLTGVMTSQVGFDTLGHETWANAFGSTGTLTEQMGFAANGQKISEIDHSADGSETSVLSTAQGVVSSQTGSDAQGHILWSNAFDASGVLTTQDSFSFTGVKLVEIDHASDGSSVRVNYSTAGTIQSQAGYDTSGHEVWSNTFNSAGTLIEQDAFNVDGTQAVAITHNNDGTSLYTAWGSNGLISNQESYNANGFEVWSNTYSSTGTLLQQNGYAANGVKTLEIDHAADGGSLIATWDAAGHFVSEEAYAADGHALFTAPAYVHPADVIF